VAGGPTGEIFAYDPLRHRLLGAFETGTGGFVNDQAVTPAEDAYFTDSLRPVIWRVRASALGSARPRPAEAWRELAGSPIAYGAGFNLNGIVATSGGRHLLTVQSNTGRVFGVSTVTGKVVEVDLGGRTVPAGDGLALMGRTLLVVPNSARTITKVRLRPGYASGLVFSETT
jgi:Cu-Zn family superoxide dismutase